jgi:sulfite reductase (NADPH) flavoprotein alpha-component
VALVLLCLTGLYVRWPARVGDWRQWLHVDFAIGGRAFWRRMHMVVGTVTLVLYLAAALTGLYFAFGWYRQAVLAVSGASAPARGAARLSPPVEGPPNVAAIWTAFEGSGARYSLATLNLPQAPDQAADLRYLAPDAPHERAFNRLAIHPLTGAVLARQLYVQQSFGTRAVSAIFPLHSGRLLGVAGTVLMMFASLAMPFFAITGWHLYLKRRRYQQLAAAEVQVS